MPRLASRMGGARVVRLQPGLFELRLPGVNAFLLDAGADGLLLVDAGLPGSAGAIREGVHAVGRSIAEVRHILVTHCHPDHAGGVAEMKALTGARVYMHRRDAMLLSRGVGMRRLNPTPGVLNRVLHRWIVATKGRDVPAVRTDVFVGNGDWIPLAGGIAVLHAPGHTEGHLAFHLPEKSVVFVGDAAANLLGVRLMPAYEHLRQGIMSLRRLCHLDFKMACFGHGPTILENADRRFRERWGPGKAGRRRSEPRRPDPFP